jgi:hypothetical protein
MVELNIKNIDVSRKIFGKSANIYHGSFLEDGWKDAFGIDKFDIIMGNPPFNNSKDGDKGKAKGGNDLYPLFILKSVELLKKNCYLLFVNPPKWRAPDKKGNIKLVSDLLREKQMIFLKIIGIKETKKLFNIAGKVDYYLLQNTENRKSTVVIDELGKKHNLKLDDMPFLPNYAYEEINKLLTTEDKGIDVIYSRNQFGTDKEWVHETKTSEYKYPILHSIKQNGSKTIYYTNTKIPDVKKFIPMFGISKVIITKGYPYTYNDYDGKYGLSNYSFGIPIKSRTEGELISNSMKTPMFNKISSATKWNSGYTEQNMFKYFKPNWYNILLEENEKSKSGTIKSKSITPTLSKSSTRKSKSKTQSKSKSSTKKSKSKTQSKSKPYTRKSKSKTESKSKPYTRKSKSKTPPVEDMDKTKPRKSMIKLGKKSRKLRRMLLKRREGTRKK